MACWTITCKAAPCRALLNLVTFALISTGCIYYEIILFLCSGLTQLSPPSQLPSQCGVSSWTDGASVCRHRQETSSGRAPLPPKEWEAPYSSVPPRPNTPPNIPTFPITQRFAQWQPGQEQNLSPQIPGVPGSHFLGPHHSGILLTHGL